jgi:hypothetical protein
MKERYRLFLRRKSVYHAFDNTTKTFKNLKIKDKAFDLIRSRLLIETQAGHPLEVFRKGIVSTNACLRRIHSFAVDMNWLAATVIPWRQWSAIRFREKRAINYEEHLKILAGDSSILRNNKRLALRRAIPGRGGKPSQQKLFAKSGHYQGIHGQRQELHV